MSNHPLADRSLAENETVWQALSAEFDAAMVELQRCLQAVEDGPSAEVEAAVQRAMQRCEVVESAIKTFLDALDHGT